MLCKIIIRSTKLLTRRGALIEEQGSTYLADHDGDSDGARTHMPPQAAVCTYRIAFGPPAGQKVLTGHGAMPRDTGFKRDLCANFNGFSVHAAVRCSADGRKSLEQLCRYVTRLALPNERTRCNAAGQVLLMLKTPCRDGDSHLAMLLPKFMQRLAALVIWPCLPAFEVFRANGRFPSARSGMRMSRVGRLPAHAYGR